MFKGVHKYTRFFIPTHGAIQTQFLSKNDSISSSSSSSKSHQFLGCFFFCFLGEPEERGEPSSEEDSMRAANFPPGASETAGLEIGATFAEETSRMTTVQYEGKCPILLHLLQQLLMIFGQQTRPLSLRTR